MLATDAQVPTTQQTISYTTFDCPSQITQGAKTASFVYGCSDERVKMTIQQNNATLLTRYYMDDIYELDETVGSTKEKLYLGGNAYSAPMVYVKQGNTGWTLYNLGRDYLGSVTHVASADGVLVAEYSYDPWGRLRNPETLAAYGPGLSPELFTGRGYTGHEHLPEFELINMNARLYDPYLGRFLSPDPFVQTPDFTQNFNRYSYALNNPLKYTDKSGESLSALTIVGISSAIYALGNVFSHAYKGDIENTGDAIKYIFQGAITGALVGLTYNAMGAIAGSQMMGFWGGCVKGAAGVTKFLMETEFMVNSGSFAAGLFLDLFRGGKTYKNSLQVFLGRYYLNDHSFLGGIAQGFARSNWASPQTMLGEVYSQMDVAIGRSLRVDYLYGRTFLTEENAGQEGPAVTFGDYIRAVTNDSVGDSFEDFVITHPMYQHEYGHSIDSWRWGPLYLLNGLLSLGNVLNWWGPEDHQKFFTEVSANKRGRNHFSNWEEEDYPVHY